jgi:arylsulfatase A-like enzyme
VDLAGTIAEYAGVTPGRPQDGRSLIPLLDGTATEWTEEVLLEVVAKTNRGFYGIAVPGWKYAEYYNGDKELYDLANDPAELDNQANNPAFQAKKDELAQKLRDLRGF